MIITKDIGNGKTSDLINLADGRNGYIVCHSRDEAHRIFKQARMMGKNISLPITYDEFLNYCGYPVKFYFDNFDMFMGDMVSRMLNGRKISVVTMTEDLCLSKLLEGFIDG